MGAYATDDSMYKWLDNNKHALLDEGKGFTGGKRKHHYAPLSDTAKSKAWDERQKQGMANKKMPKHIHYGDERNPKVDKVMTWDKDGHTVSLYADGNLTCNCMGWIFKRHGVQRECVHVREKYAELKKCKVPAKHSKPREIVVAEQISKISRQIARQLIAEYNI